MAGAGLGDHRAGRRPAGGLRRHADTRTSTAKDPIEWLLAATDPVLVNLGLDSGHVANCGRNNVKIIRQNLERITQVHLKQLNPDVRERLRRETLSLAEAVPLALRCEPPYGEPDMPELRAALARRRPPRAR